MARLPYRSRSQSRDCSAYLRDWLARHGHFEAGPRNRIVRMCETVMALEFPVHRRDPNFDVVDVSMTDLQEFEEIAEQLTPVLHIGPVRAKLRRSLGDDDIPSNDCTRQSQGRDTQFELVIACMLLRAGGKLHPTPSSEAGLPDWQVRMVCMDTCAVEAKRVKSRNDERIRKSAFEAMEQIDRLARPGLAVIDLTARGNPTHTSVPSSATNELLRQHFDRQGEQLEEMLMQRVFKEAASLHTGAIAFRESVPRSGSMDGSVGAGVISGWNVIRNPFAPPATFRTIRNLWSRVAYGLPGSHLPMRDEG